MARTLVDSVVQVGVAESRILRAAKLEPESRQALDSRLPRSKCYELIELALELTGDPAFGLHSVERLASDALNPISALVIHSATLQEAVRSILDFRRLLGDEASFRIYEDRGKVFIECDSLPSEVLPVRRFMTEVTLLGLFRIIRRFRADAHIDYVAFEYGAPD